MLGTWSRLRSVCSSVTPRLLPLPLLPHLQLRFLSPVPRVSLLCLGLKLLALQWRHRLPRVFVASSATVAMTRGVFKLPQWQQSCKSLGLRCLSVLFLVVVVVDLLLALRPWSVAHSWTSAPRQSQWPLVGAARLVVVVGPVGQSQAVISTLAGVVRMRSSS